VRGSPAGGHQQHQQGCQQPEAQHGGRGERQWIGGLIGKGWAERGGLTRRPPPAPIEGDVTRGLRMRGEVVCIRVEGVPVTWRAAAAAPPGRSGTGVQASPCRQGGASQ
jgi:hypothetical protein